MTKPNNKKAEVRGDPDFDDAYEALPEGSLKNAVDDAMTHMSENPGGAGISIPKKNIPPKYTKNGITNLFKINLPRAWRLIYTILGSKNRMVCKMLDLLDHDTYKKIFGYHSS